MWPHATFTKPKQLAVNPKQILLTKPPRPYNPNTTLKQNLQPKLIYCELRKLELPVTTYLIYVKNDNN